MINITTTLIPTMITEQKKYNKELDKYYIQCNRILDLFIEKYYAEYGYSPEFYWIAEETGEVASIDDDFWNMSDMITALRLNIEEDTLFEWYYDSIDARLKKETVVNLKNYIQFNNN